MIRTVQQQRALAALQLIFVADALAMPVHWFYNLQDIERAFPGGIKDFTPAPAEHPTSIMALHSTAHGGRGGHTGSTPEIKCALSHCAAKSLVIIFPFCQHRLQQFIW